jgi:hypothetical protein
LVAASIAAVCIVGSAASAQPAGASTQGPQAQFEMTSSAGGAAAPAPWETCQQAIKSQTHRAATRWDWCDAEKGYVYTWNSNGVITGTATINILFYIVFANNSRTWYLDENFLETACTLALCGVPIIINIINTCSATCTVTGARTWSFVVPVAPANPYNEPVSVNSPGSALTISTATMTLTATLPSGPAQGLISLTSGGTRCDSNSVGQSWPTGCVNPYYVPTYEISRSSYPNIAPFDAQQIAAHPQWSILTRTTNSARISANRTAACKGFVPNNSTDTCDEFPYATTYEGGVGPPPAAQEHVPQGENSSQGGTLGTFYTFNRLLDGDAFHVVVIP